MAKDFSAADAFWGRMHFARRVTGPAAGAWLGVAFLLTWGIPILSAVVTFLTSEIMKDNYREWIFTLSLVLTAVTGLNSALNPRKRYAHAAKYSEILASFDTEVRLDFESIDGDTYADPAVKGEKYRECISQANAKLSRLMKAYNAGTLLAFVGDGQNEEPAVQ